MFCNKFEGHESGLSWTISGWFQAGYKLWSQRYDSLLLGLKYGVTFELLYEHNPDERLAFDLNRAHSAKKPSRDFCICSSKKHIMNDSEESIRVFGRIR